MYAMSVSVIVCFLCFHFWIFMYFVVIITIILIIIFLFLLVAYYTSDYVSNKDIYKVQDHSTYTEPVPLKYGKLASKYPWIYRYFTMYRLCVRVFVSFVTCSLLLLITCSHFLLLVFSFLFNYPLFFPLRIAPPRFQAGCRKSWLNLGYNLCRLFVVVVFLRLMICISLISCLQV